MVCRLVTNLETWGELWPTIPGNKIFPQQKSCTLFVQRNLAVFGVWPIKTYSPNFVNFGPGVPWYRAATCISPSLVHL